ncbi:MAG: phage portal protein [Mesotoga sp.]|nr:phage portal protein [Mesotoga sp.]MDD2334713.1 phage portal protein [Mesotoga sp.]MDD3680649.1 phage portal protein [Mesotoga sp.]MDD4825379.1 phage portal protein [Mesotoga sp.]MDD5682061.1 phage portal protein [Mesotoga sp.]
MPGLEFGGLVRYSPISMAMNAIVMAIACEYYGAQFFANGATLEGVLEYLGTIKHPQKVNESWNTAYQGSSA